jgi:nucleotide-binding universal stress UspA family protein
VNQVRKKFSIQTAGLILGTSVAAILTTGATLIIFEERFLEGAWVYFILIPILYYAFTYFRKRIGAPSPEMDYLGQINSALLAGFGFGQTSTPSAGNGNGTTVPARLGWTPELTVTQYRLTTKADIQHLLVLLDGSDYAAQALPYAQFFCETSGAQLTLLSASKDYQSDNKKLEEAENYLCSVAEKIHAAGIKVNCQVFPESPTKATQKLVAEKGVDLVVVTTRGASGEKNWLREGLSSKLVQLLDIPVLLVQVFESGASEAPHIGRILVALDGSAFAEQLLPYARFLGKQFDCELMLISVPSVPESEKYRAPASIIQAIRKQAVSSMQKYLDSVSQRLSAEGLSVRSVVSGSYPARAIVDVGKREGVDLIMITSQGRGGLDLVFMGSVAQQVVQLTDSPVFILPIIKELVNEPIPSTRMN